MSNKPLETKEPNFHILSALFEKYRNKKTKAVIFDMWRKSILPAVPQITLIQFINWTRNLIDRENEEAFELTRTDDAAVIEQGRIKTISELEESLREVSSDLLDDARDTMKMAREEGGVPLKERYYALGVVEKLWGKTIKEKEIAIKAHAEKRESVGLFAKLLRGAMSGELSMKDVELMRKNCAGESEQLESEGAEVAVSGSN